MLRAPEKKVFLICPDFMYLLCPHRINQTHLLPSYLTNRRLGLQVQGSNFTLGGFPFLIIAGTIHYFRVPKEYWRDRLLKMKAGGFNTLITHVPWNLHEPKIGQFRFTGNLDVMAFITMASQLGLWVILCPGPYIGSDLDLGGLPSWLLRDPNMKLRTTYKGFTKAVNVYFDHLIPRILPLQYNRGGPIIAMQVENEYGSYYLDKKYMPYVKKVSVPLNFLCIYIPIFFYPIMMTVYTVTSFDSWGVAHHSLDGPVLLKDVREMFKRRFSFNFYMFHGGTNFGFMGGAQHLNVYYPVVTSYEYGALLRENGDYTPEYTTFQEFFRSVIGTQQQPQSECLFFSLLSFSQPTKSVKPLTMEQLSVNEGSGQSYGYTLYETFISTDGILTSKGHVQDRGQVFLDDKHVGILDHSQDQLILQKHDHKEYHILRILVENQGRLASGKNMNQERKGLTGDIYLNNSPLRKFTIYSLEMKSIFMTRKLPNIWKPITEKVKGPAFFLGYLKVADNPKDTFIQLEGWKKGVVFINGQNLGRYWSIGPQGTLYLPGPWLHPGTNEIILFEELESGIDVQFKMNPILGIDLFIFVVFRIKPRALCMPGKHSPTELHP
uniref:Beta-galactosidase n=1 Tax=Sciurus vulgaris TaxID=55149 RepID=A0A8D2B0X4_SCIVU